MSRPLIYGEIIWDLLPNGNKVLGGCALNVAWHLQAMGSQPRLISRVGNDAFGQEGLARMQAWGMDTTGVQIDAERPTASLQVTITPEGKISFTGGFPRAIDFIEQAEAHSDFPTPSLLYHGTYVLRGTRSTETLQRLRRSNRPIFIDVNLRPPHWDRKQVLAIVHGADYVKVNDEELKLLYASAAESSGPLADENFLFDLARRFATDLKIGTLLLTLGEKGAVLFKSGQSWRSQRVRSPHPFVDAIGAGDAFCASFIHDLISGSTDEETMLNRACEFAARSCAIPGATPATLDFYSGV